MHKICFVLGWFKLKVQEIVCFLLSFSIVMLVCHSQRIPATCWDIRNSMCVWIIVIECANKNIHMQVFQCLSLSEAQIKHSLFFDGKNPLSTLPLLSCTPVPPLFPSAVKLSLLCLSLFACSLCCKDAAYVFYLCLKVLKMWFAVCSFFCSKCWVHSLKLFIKQVWSTVF